MEQRSAQATDLSFLRGRINLGQFHREREWFIVLQCPLEHLLQTRLRAIHVFKIQKGHPYVQLVLRVAERNRFQSTLGQGAGGVDLSQGNWKKKTKRKEHESTTERAHSTSVSKKERAGMRLAREKEKGMELYLSKD